MNWVYKKVGINLMVENKLINRLSAAVCILISLYFSV